MTLPSKKSSLILAFLLSALGTIGYLGWQAYLKKQQTHQLALHWRLFEEAAFQLDAKSMKELLEKIKTIKSDDPLIALRENALTSGHADPSDSVMIVYWLNEYLGQNRLEDAAPEALKRVAAEEQDWQARCVLADFALRNHRREEAISHLKKLPAPMTVQLGVRPSGLMYALALHRRAEPFLTPQDKEDWFQPAVDSLRSFRASRLVTILRTTIVEKLLNIERLQLLECYLQAFEDLDREPTLPTFWVPASKVCQLVLEESQVTNPELIRLGELQMNFLTVLGLLRSQEKIQPADHAELLRDLEERIESTWQKLREREPKNPRSYLGLAQLALHQKQFQKGLKLLEEGQQECGKSPELLMEQSRLLQVIDPQIAVREMGKAAEGSENPLVWAIYFQAAQRAGRNDLAIYACQQARKIDPRLEWASLFEAELSLSRNRHSDALEALAPFRDQVRSNPKIAILYLRALLLAQAESQVQTLLKEINLETWSAEAATVILQILLKAGQMEVVIPQIDQLVKRFPEQREVRFLQADAYRIWSEPTEGSDWNQDRLQVAVNALRWLQQREPENLQVIHVLVYLQIQALDTPDVALRTADPLRRAEASGKLPAAMQETLGAVYLRVGRYDEARRILEISAPRHSSAEAWVDLGLACHHLNRTDEAKAYLQKAASLPRSPRESKHLNQALKTVEGK